ncbi:hemolysin III family channel protein [Paenibacillus dendritiformis C454]|uniref:Hemolysin III family channel protein n=1 Tax=Paenibacillus dendritiformis C454 TaxID=1131935 RepID=H3SF33_9BACL|nr:hemolysin III family protein [Paenibacillus dendritiformis]EHQ62352.1 hemolysin III family channel protein [Paenibacillus dendritiformis C454]
MMDRPSLMKRRDERASAYTHGIGMVCSLGALALLVEAGISHGTVWHIVSAGVYGLTLVMMFAISTIMHSTPEGERKAWLTMADHMSIYVFIGGNYTPFLLVYMRNEFGWKLLGAIWGTAIAGIIVKRYYTGRYMWISTIGYLAMGWLIVAAWPELSAVLSPAGLVLLVCGGISYSAGIVFFVWEKLPYHHAIWHLFVLAGAGLHFVCIYRYVLLG